MRTISGKIVITQDGQQMVKLSDKLMPGDKVIVTIQEDVAQTENETEPRVQFFNQALQGIVHEAPLPGMLQRSREEVLAQLAKVFTPEEMANVGKTNFSLVALEPNLATRFLLEDRESYKY